MDDVYSNGVSRSRDREYHARYAERRKQGMSILRAYESAGMTATEALRIITETPPDVLIYLARRDPDTVQRAWERLR